MILNKCHIASLVISGVVLVAAAVVLIGGYHIKLINNEIDDQLSLDLDSPQFNDWMNPPPPIYMQYWLFNLSNHKEFLNGEKANLTQVGPFTYKLLQPRYDVAFYDNNTVSYKYNHTLVFQRDKSYRDANDVTITTLNMPLIIADNLLRTIPGFAALKKLLIWLLGDANLVVKHSAHEILFGYDDRIFHFVNEFMPSYPAKFGLFYGFNNSDDGVYLADTGKKDISKVNEIYKWNHDSLLSYWSNEYGNMLNGTDGVFFHPGMSTNETIYAFSTDICRSLPFEFEQKSKVNGVNAYRYHTTARAFANASVNPDNAAFCVPAGNCMGSGVLNISVCKQGAPIIISSPHFYLADQKYVDGVNGMDPIKSQHETNIDVEPTTGVVVRAQKRLQLNIQLEPSKVAKELKNVVETTFPILWLNESVYIDDGSAKHLREVISLKKFVLSVPYVLIAISAILLLGVIISLVVVKRRNRDALHILVNEDDDDDK